VKLPTCSDSSTTFDGTLATVCSFALAYYDGKYQSYNKMNFSTIYHPVGLHPRLQYAKVAVIQNIECSPFLFPGSMKTDTLCASDIRFCQVIEMRVKIAL